MDDHTPPFPPEPPPAPHERCTCSECRKARGALSQWLRLELVVCSCGAQVWANLGRKLCDACRNPAPKGRRQPAPCGTYGGYQAHFKRKTKPCDACKAAAAQRARETGKHRKRYAKSPERRAADNQRSRRYYAETYRVRRGHGMCPCGKSVPVNRRKCDACIKETAQRREHEKRAKRRGARLGERYTLAEIAKRDGFRCHLCRKKVRMSLSGMHPDGPTIDHLVPISAGGLDERKNVALAHRRCNCARGAGGEAQLLLVG